MKFGTSFVLFATISMMFAVAYAEEEAPEAAVVVTTEAAAEAPVTGGAVGGAEPAKEAPAVAAGEVTGKAGGADIEVTTAAIVPLVTSDAPVTPSIETTTKASNSLISHVFAFGCFFLVALHQ
ncbi:hypothetical protein GCK72_013842 [Caenorhabditis remanei]|uniref:Uncharacterized protein n=1 Tax=Caenorhabditis remanei TaxID=31234 RepID=E3M724_CAERE|nr:hypothetical protein GCK72_013842 [Caenorhabditis remanei]EFO93903.1 hypothetical protein CRE_12468 [Caenorhabditis remanei]KAF1757386.1 hypothetical protein GCK72_013842 [Caenorhabditis remanei]